MKMLEIKNCNFDIGIAIFNEDAGNQKLQFRYRNCDFLTRFNSWFPIECLPSARGWKLTE